MRVAEKDHRLRKQLNLFSLLTRADAISAGEHYVDIVGVTSSILVTPTIQVSKGLTGNRKPFFNSPNLHCTRRPTQATEAETGTLNGGDSASLSKARGFSEELSRVLHVRLLKDTYLAIDHGCTGIG
ncbi:hypothetical protein VPK21_005561 [Sinorhizobium kummerowiae]|uniref:Uncharacterized protein n=1 Tax=Sinorhizobium kummerowiae TaxID=158892 RepID=A0ABY8TC21_9HYPH|nr:hypothetical protein [Sinorhizobium kummerowiae]WHS95362.1 hypothetical protein PZL22_003143 [Sinorhizobium kummerowiae]WRW47329.1 hypothetical protein VPK21_005561 [Sinorhizobium kummerowiae]